MKHLKQYKLFESNEHKLHNLLGEIKSKLPGIFIFNTLDMRNMIIATIYGEEYDIHLVDSNKLLIDLFQISNIDKGRGFMGTPDESVAAIKDYKKRSDNITSLFNIEFEDDINFSIDHIKLHMYDITKEQYQISIRFNILNYNIGSEIVSNMIKNTLRKYDSKIVCEMNIKTTMLDRELDIIDATFICSEITI